MAVVMNMHWDGVTPDQYNQARERVNWEGDTPDGALLHVPWFTDSGLQVLDVWESPEQFQRFSDERLGPVVQEIGIEGEPRVEFNPLHEDHIFAPGVAKVSA